MMKNDNTKRINSSITSVAVTRETKARMDKWRAKGQCYDGFLIQIITLWERMHSNRTGSSGKNVVPAPRG